MNRDDPNERLLLPLKGQIDRDGACERVVVVRPSALPGAELMAIYDSTQPWHFLHERYALTACVSGECGVRYRRVHSDLAGPCTLVFEPGEVHHHTYVSKPSCFRVFFVEPHTFRECARELGAPGAFHYPRPFGTDPALFRVLNSLCMSIEQHDSLLVQQSLYAQCVVDFGAHAERKISVPEVTNAKQALERARAHLVDRYTESVGLDDLVRVSRLSRFHLVHSFTRHFGIPPHAYQIHVRIERGCALLRKGMSPAGAAFEVGFVDQSHFTRHFKRIMGVTPAQYATS